MQREDKSNPSKPFLVKSPRHAHPSHRSQLLSRAHTMNTSSFESTAPQHKRNHHTREEVLHLRNWVHAQLLASADDSQSKVRILKQIQILNAAHEELAKIVSLHCSTSGELASRIWRSNQEIHDKLFEEMAVSLKQHQFMLMEKTKHCEALERELKSRSKLSKDESISRGGNKGNISTGLSHESRKPIADLDQVFLFRAMEEEIVRKDREMLELQSTIAAVAIWFPNFSKYASSILSRYLPPADYIEQTIFTNKPKNKRGSLEAVDAKVKLVPPGNGKPKIVYPRSKLFFQDVKIDGKKPHQRHGENDNGDNEELEDGDDTDDDADAMNEDAKRELKSNMAQRYLVNDLKRLQLLGIGLGVTHSILDRPSGSNVDDAWKLPAYALRQLVPSSGSKTTRHGDDIGDGDGDQERKRATTTQSEPDSVVQSEALPEMWSSTMALLPHPDPPLASVSGPGGGIEGGRDSSIAQEAIVSTLRARSSPTKSQHQHSDPAVAVAVGRGEKQVMFALDDSDVDDDNALNAACENGNSKGFDGDGNVAQKIDELEEEEQGNDTDGHSLDSTRDAMNTGNALTAEQALELVTDMSVFSSPMARKLAKAMAEAVALAQQRVMKAEAETKDVLRRFQLLMEDAQSLDQRLSELSAIVHTLQSEEAAKEAAWIERVEDLTRVNLAAVEECANLQNQCFSAAHLAAMVPRTPSTYSHSHSYLHLSHGVHNSHLPSLATDNSRSNFSQQTLHTLHTFQAHKTVEAIDGNAARGDEGDEAVASNSTSTAPPLVLESPNDLVRARSPGDASPLREVSDPHRAAPRSDHAGDIRGRLPSPPLMEFSISELRAIVVRCARALTCSNFEPFARRNPVESLDANTRSLFNKIGPALEMNITERHYVIFSKPFNDDISGADPRELFKANQNEIELARSLNDGPGRYREGQSQQQQQHRSRQFHRSIFKEALIEYYSLQFKDCRRAHDYVESICSSAWGVSSALGVRPVGYLPSVTRITSEFWPPPSNPLSLSGPISVHNEASDPLSEEGKTIAAEKGDAEGGEWGAGSAMRLDTPDERLVSAAMEAMSSWALDRATDPTAIPGPSTAIPGPSTAIPGPLKTGSPLEEVEEEKRRRSVEVPYNGEQLLAEAVKSPSGKGERESEGEREGEREGVPQSEKKMKVETKANPRNGNAHFARVLQELLPMCGASKVEECSMKFRRPKSFAPLAPNASTSLRDPHRSEIFTNLFLKCFASTQRYLPPHCTSKPSGSSEAVLGDVDLVPWAQVRRMLSRVFYVVKRADPCLTTIEAAATAIEGPESTILHSRTARKTFTPKANRTSAAGESHHSRGRDRGVDAAEAGEAGAVQGTISHEGGEDTGADVASSNVRIGSDLQASAPNTAASSTSTASAMADFDNAKKEQGEAFLGIAAAGAAIGGPGGITITPERLLMSPKVQTTPWWLILPAHYFERLKMDIYMSSFRLKKKMAQGKAQAKAQIISQSNKEKSHGIDTGKGPLRGGDEVERKRDDLCVDCFEVIMLCFNSVQRLHSELTEVLQAMFRFLQSVVVGGATSRLFHSLLNGMLECNAHKLKAFTSWHRLYSSSSVHVQLAVELRELELQQSSSSQLLPQLTAEAFADAVLRTRSPLVCLGLLDHLTFVPCATPAMDADDTTDLLLQSELDNQEAGTAFWKHEVERATRAFLRLSELRLANTQRRTEFIQQQRTREKLVRDPQPPQQQQQQQQQQLGSNAVSTMPAEPPIDKFVSSSFKRSWFIKVAQQEEQEGKVMGTYTRSDSSGVITEFHVSREKGLTAALEPTMRLIAGEASAYDVDIDKNADVGSAVEGMGDGLASMAMDVTERLLLRAEVWLGPDTSEALKSVVDRRELLFCCRALSTLEDILLHQNDVRSPIRGAKQKGYEKEDMKSPLLNKGALRAEREFIAQNHYRFSLMRSHFNKWSEATLDP